MGKNTYKLKVFNICLFEAFQTIGNIQVLFSSNRMIGIDIGEKIEQNRCATIL
jgi:hypothetical protein